MTKEVNIDPFEDDSKDEDMSEGVKLDDILKSIRGMIDDQQNLSTKKPKQDKSDEVESYLEFQDFNSDKVKEDNTQNHSETIHVEDAQAEDVLELTDEIEVHDTRNADEHLIAENVRDKSAGIISNFTEQAKEAQKPKAVKMDKELDTVVHKLMRPLIKEWLDSNLPSIVEKVVANEIKKLVPKK